MALPLSVSILSFVLSKALNQPADTRFGSSSELRKLRAFPEVVLMVAVPLK